VLQEDVLGFSDKQSRGHDQATQKPYWQFDQTLLPM